MTRDTLEALKRSYRSGAITKADEQRMVEELIHRDEELKQQKDSVGEKLREIAVALDIDDFDK